jgi:hypothetical protein
MKSINFARTIAIIAAMVLAAGTNALAQTPKHLYFGGTINDYTPASDAGPYEVRGHWSLWVDESGKADFAADVTMERSDMGVLQNGSSDLNNPTVRNAHTHHIMLRGGTVTALPNGSGFQVIGPAKITANGAFPPPFGPVLPTLTIQITGGNTVPLSNITVLFGAPAAGHFGMYPLHGVVRP